LLLILGALKKKHVSKPCLDKVLSRAPQSAKPSADIKLIQSDGDQNTATKFAMSQWGVVKINVGSMLAVL